jgi:predicted RNase H-like HicB family nuclease
MKTMHEPKDYEVRIWYSSDPGDRCYVAQVVEWPSIMAHGDTREDAGRQIELALALALESAQDAGIQPPAPALVPAA